jgi:hypothetical protein
MWHRFLLLLPCALTLGACEPVGADRPQAAAADLSVGTCTSGCAIGSVESANLLKFDARLVSALADAAGSALSGRASGFVRVTHPTSQEEIRNLGFEPRAIRGEIAAVEFSLAEALRASRVADVVSIHIDGPVGPAVDQAPSVVVASESPIDSIKGAAFEKVDSAIVAAIEARLAEAFSQELVGSVGFRVAKTDAEIEELGFVPRTTGALDRRNVLVEFSLEVALRASRSDEVVVIRNTTPTLQSPGTGEPGTTHDKRPSDPAL